MQAPDGNYTSSCGMWYVAEIRIAYMEPLATDPDYRRLGLGKASVWEGIRRCKALGAEMVYVGSDQEFYKAMGFMKKFDSRCWEKQIESGAS